MADELRPCPRCGGKGHQASYIENGGGQIIAVPEDCQTCAGKGTVTMTDDLKAPTAEEMERQIAYQHEQAVRLMERAQAAEARATTAEATLARYREALERARDLLRGSSNILNEASAFAIIDAALLPSPATETEGGRG